MKDALLGQLAANTVVDAKTGCWAWTARLDRDGYGRVTVERKVRSAHRVAYELIVGPIPDGLELDHVCHTKDADCPGGNTCPHRQCINPAHLEPVTFEENQRRSLLNFMLVNRAKTHCDSGHEFTTENTYVSIQRGRARRTCRSCQAAAVARYKKRRHEKIERAAGLQRGAA